MSAPQSSISAFDVARYAKQLERDFSGSTLVSLSLPVREVGGAAFNVRLSFVRLTGGSAGGHYERGVSGVWPSHTARTYFGLLFRLYVELDKLLSEELREAERRTQGRLPL